MALSEICFTRRYGAPQALGNPMVSTKDGAPHHVTGHDRDLLESDPDSLFDSLWQRVRQAREQETAAVAQAHKLLLSKTHSGLKSPNRPWAWQSTTSTSVAVMRAPTGQCWVRLQHQDGTQKVAPFPVFEGWEKALPEEVGQADHDMQAFAVASAAMALAAMKAMGFEGPTVGRWRDVGPRQAAAA